MKKRERCIERKSQYWPRGVCLDFLQQRLCPRAAITMKEPHNTHKQGLTHTHIVCRIHTEMRAKQTTEGGDRDWCVLALGGLWSSNSYVAPSKEWPQRSGLHKDKEDKQSKSTQHCPSVLWRTVDAKELLQAFRSRILTQCWWLHSPALECRCCLQVRCLHHSQKPVNLSSERICLPILGSAQKTCPAAFLTSTTRLQPE